MLKVRGLLGLESGTDVVTGSNAPDDTAINAFQDGRGDVPRNELLAEIEGLTDPQQGDLMIVLWLGRSYVQRDQWDEFVEQARDVSPDPPPMTPPATPCRPSSGQLLPSWTTNPQREPTRTKSAHGMIHNADGCHRVPCVKQLISPLQEPRASAFGFGILGRRRRTFEIRKHHVGRRRIMA